MVRGGRSCPPDWKAGMGAVSAGKATEEIRLGCPSDGTVQTMEAMQQPLAQKWQLAGCSPVEEWSLAASPLAWWCADEWSACISWPACMSWCPCSATTAAELGPSPSGHSMVAAIAPRMGSRMANRITMKMRKGFTSEDYRAGGLCVYDSRSSMCIGSRLIRRRGAWREAWLACALPRSTSQHLLPSHRGWGTPVGRHRDSFEPAVRGRSSSREALQPSIRVP